MDILLSLGVALLALVFGVAGIAKLIDREGTEKSIRDFGVSQKFSGWLRFVLPPSELLVAALLLIPSSVYWGGVGAIVLLTIFTLVIGLNLLSGRAPDCHCFGQLRSGPIGWWTLARNAGLIAVAGLIVAAGQDSGGPSVVRIFSPTVGTSVGLAGIAAGFATVAALGWLVTHLLRQQGRLLVRLDRVEAALESLGVAVEFQPVKEEGLAVGSTAPDFQSRTLAGSVVTRDQLLGDGLPLLLIFTDPLCTPCATLIPRMLDWSRAHDELFRVTIVTRGSAEANLSKLSGLPNESVLLQTDREIAELYRAVGTPAAVLIQANGMVGSAVALGAQRIADLVSGLILPGGERKVRGEQPNRIGPSPHRGSSPHVVGVGQQVPSLKLPDLDGVSVDLQSLVGQSTLVVFWNPDCGFCRQMLPELKAWELVRPNVSPRLVVVSRGTVDSNRAMRLDSTVLLDQTFEAGRMFGAIGTPAAVLIDEAGRIASSVTAGAAPVLALAAVRPVAAHPATN